MIKRDSVIGRARGESINLLISKSINVKHVSDAR